MKCKIVYCKKKYVSLFSNFLFSFFFPSYNNSFLKKWTSSEVSFSRQRYLQNLRNKYGKIYIDMLNTHANSPSHPARAEREIYGSREKPTQLWDFRHRFDQQKCIIHMKTNDIWYYSYNALHEDVQVENVCPKGKTQRDWKTRDWCSSTTQMRFKDCGEVITVDDTNTISTLVNNILLL